MLLHMVEVLQAVCHSIPQVAAAHEMQMTAAEP
jgi:hypothetical protein